MRTPLIAGNWKMNGTQQFSNALLEQIISQYDSADGIEFAVFPPFVYLDTCHQLLTGSKIGYGAQNVSDKPDGALTGEISASMLQDLACRFVIIGHSERRLLLGESNDFIAKKTQAVLHAGLQPILCVGETLEQRQSGETLTIVQEQLAHVLRLKDNLPALETLIVAYEPVWAIGTGESATPEQAEEVHATIRLCCNTEVPGLGEKIRVLYGGSVKPENVASLSRMPNIDGALVGGASLKADQFIEIGKRWNKS